MTEPDKSAKTPSRGVPFAKGNKLGKGRPRLPVDLAKAKDKAKQLGPDWFRFLVRYLKSPLGKLTDAGKDPQRQVGEIAVIRFLAVTLGSRNPHFYGPLCKMLGIDFDAAIKIQHSLPEDLTKLDEYELDRRIANLVKLLYGDRPK